MSSLAAQAQPLFDNIVAEPEQPVSLLDTKVATLIENISNSASGCLVDMHLRNFLHAMKHENLKPTPLNRIKIEDAVTARTMAALADQDLHQSFKSIWYEWETQSFPRTLDRIAKRELPSQAASLAATPATRAP